MVAGHTVLASLTGVTYQMFLILMAFVIIWVV